MRKREVFGGYLGW